MERIIHCSKLQRQAKALSAPPYPGELGQKIYEHISEEAWQLWLNHQTLLINENQLSMADAQARQYLKEEMEKFFFGPGSEHPEGYTPQ